MNINNNENEQASKLNSEHLDMRLNRLNMEFHCTPEKELERRALAGVLGGRWGIRWLLTWLFG